MKEQAGMRIDRVARALAPGAKALHCPSHLPAVHLRENTIGAGDKVPRGSWLVGNMLASVQSRGMSVSGAPKTHRAPPW